MNPIDPVLIAEVVATVAHEGQTDKAGEPYIEHPKRIASLRSLTERQRVLAWLHDVLEDTNVTRDFIARQFGESVLEDLEALTHRPHEPYLDYLDRVLAASSDAIVVKLLDIADNADPRRLERLDEATRQRLSAKYEKAINHLRKGGLK